MTDRLIKIGSGCFCRVRDLVEGDVIRLLGGEYTVARLDFGDNGYVRIITTNGPYRYLVRTVDEVTLVKAGTNEMKEEKKMPEEIVTIRGYECLNTQEAIRFTGMREAGFVKGVQRRGLTKFHTPERPGETFYVRTQLAALRYGTEIPAIDIQREESSQAIDVSWLISLIADALKEANKQAELIARGKGGREVVLAITNLQQAKHWAVDAQILLNDRPIENLSNEAELRARHASAGDRRDWNEVERLEQEIARLEE